MGKKPWIKNTKFRLFGEDSDEVSIRVARPKARGALGTWEPQTGELRIAPGQTPEQQLVILIHEAMHLAETLLIVNKKMRKQVNHDFITNSAFALATTLVHAGVIKGITPEAWDRFWAAQEAEAAE